MTTTEDGITIEETGNGQYRARRHGRVVVSSTADAAAARLRAGDERAAQAAAARGDTLRAENIGRALEWAGAKTAPRQPHMFGAETLRAIEDINAEIAGRGRRRTGEAALPLFE